MNIQVSERVKKIKPSPTMVVSAKATKLATEGHNIINLAAGEPDFGTPEHVKEAAIQAIREDQTKYTAVGGTAQLIQAIIEKFATENSLQYQANQIIASCGCKHSIYNLMQALLSRNDEVIILAPYWVSYPDMTKLADAKPNIITPAPSSLKIQPEQLRAAITPKSKLLILNSPSNPSGIYYSADELAAFAEILVENPDIIIATDDIYEHIIWGQSKFQNIVNICPELYSRTVVLNGVSKAYAMTGWRIGYAGGPVALIDAMKKVQSQSTSNPSSISQVAAQTALQGSQSCISENNKIFKERHDYIYQQINQIEGISCTESQGTFYLFPNCQHLIERIKGIDNDIELAEYLLGKAGVATVPGSAFGAAGYIRLSFATSMENLQQASQHLQAVLKP